MPAPDMIERVARAIFDAENGLDGDNIGTMIHENFRVEERDGDIGLGETMDVCMAAARAAIEAMREIDDRMMIAGWRSQFEFVGGTEAETEAAIAARLADGRETELTRKGWRAAIDEALSEKESG